MHRGMRRQMSLSEWSRLSLLETNGNLIMLLCRAGLTRLKGQQAGLRGRRSPLCTFLPAGSGGSPFLLPQPLHCPGVLGLHKHPESRSEGKRRRRRQRVATIFPWAPQGSYLPLSSSSCQHSPLACLLYDQAPLQFTLQSSPLCSTLRVIFSSLAQSSL